MTRKRKTKAARRAENKSWIAAICESAIKKRIKLPPFTDQGMGSVLCRTSDGDRLVSFRRRLVPSRKAKKDGFEWALWIEKNEEPSRIVMFREALSPTRERVAFVLSVMKAWLLEEGTIEEAKAVAERDQHAVPESELAVRSEKQEYWLSENRDFGIVVKQTHWKICSKMETLST